MKKWRLSLDADTIIYQKVKGLEKTSILVEYQNNGRKKEFKNITEFRGTKKSKLGGWLGEENKRRKKKGLVPFLYKDFNFSNKVKQVAQDNVAKKALDYYIKELKELPWVKTIKLNLDGGNNFRRKLYQEYKANRGEKPLRLLEIKDWFCDKYKDIVVLSKGAEADDYLSEEGWYNWRKHGEDSDFCAGYVDKDCDQWPGYRWNYNKRGGIYFIDEFQAHHNLTVQCIIGDKSCDNIPGVPKVNDCIQDRYVIGLGGVGPVKAKRILAGCKTIGELYSEVEETYKCYYGNDYKKHLNLTYKLVKLWEHKDEIKDFPFKG